MSTHERVQCDPLGTGPRVGTVVEREPRTDSPHPYLVVDIDGSRFRVAHEDVQ